MNNIIKKSMTILCLMLFLDSCRSQEYFPQSISKNKMEVNWIHKGDRVYFEMQAPTQGWVTIGFSDRDDIEGSYLLMGRVTDSQVEVVQHYTLRPGNYKSFDQLGAEPTTADVSGAQKGNHTTIKFSVPMDGLGKFERSLIPGKDLIMILAYSRDDDFQHHSTMRTSLKVTM